MGPKRPELPDDVPGVHHVPLGLGHLLPLFVQDEAVADHVLEGDGAEEHYPELVEGVEPAPGLVNPLGDEVRGEALPECLLVLKGVV